MKKEHAKEWADALRSGDYQKGFGQLRTRLGFCCLGVRADMLSKKGVCTLGHDRLHYDSALSYLPASVVRHDDFNYLNPRFQYEVRNGDLKKEILSELNDDGLPFEQIADLIERFYDQL